jgi:hypothetical protein
MALHVDFDVARFLRRSDDDLKQSFRRCLMNGWNCVTRIRENVDDVWVASMRWDRVGPDVIGQSSVSESD